MAHWLFQKLFQKTDVKHLGSIPGQGQCCGNFDLFCDCRVENLLENLSSPKEYSNNTPDANVLPRRIHSTHLVDKKFTTDISRASSL